MSTRMKSPTIKYSATIFVAITLISGGVARANAQHFSFNAVEFMPRDERETAAQTFISNNITTGLPIPVALRILSKAGADCGTPKTSDREISCTHPSFHQTPDDTGIVDVIWTVRIDPAADGTVTSATVNRSTYGF
jgi:hypothetical protein